MRATIPLLMLSLGACTAPPTEVAQSLAQALQDGDPAAVLVHVDPDYADPQGARDQLQRDLEAMQRDFERRTVRFEDLSMSAGAPARQARLTGRLDAELVGQTTWKVVGPVQLDMFKEDAFRVRSGLLPHLRNIRALVAQRVAALEANDAQALGPLLHPNYRDGDRTADEVIEQLSRDLSGIKIRMRVSNYRLEVRGPIAHLDEHYRLTVGDRTLPPQIGRFTLERSAGLWLIRAGLSSGTGGESP